MPSQNNTKHIIGARGQANTTRQKSLARLDQITGTCVDQLFWNKEPPPPPRQCWKRAMTNSSR